jgi:hypothetical protein
MEPVSEDDREALLKAVALLLPLVERYHGSLLILNRRAMMVTVTTSVIPADPFLIGGTSLPLPPSAVVYVRDRAAALLPDWSMSPIDGTRFFASRKDSQ